MVLCPAVPPIRSVFHSGMRCSTVLTTVLASMPATAHRRGSTPRVRRRHGGPSSDEETPVSDHYDGPQTVRAGPRSDPHGDRADDVEGAAPSAGIARVTGGRVTLFDSAPRDGAATAGRMGDLDPAWLTPR
jgi:hypothetical protein